MKTLSYDQVDNIEHKINALFQENYTDVETIILKKFNVQSIDEIEESKYYIVLDLIDEIMIDFENNRS